MRRLAATTTLAGCPAPEGHDHDSNSVSSTFRCENNHLFAVEKRHKCPAPGCGWEHRERAGTKYLWVDEWPRHIKGEPHADRAPDGRWFSLIPAFFAGATWINLDGTLDESRG